MAMSSTATIVLWSLVLNRSRSVIVKDAVALQINGRLGGGCIDDRPQTHGHRAIPVNPETFEQDEDGIVLTPAHVHRALREKFGLNASNVVRDFPLSAELLPLL